MKLFFAITIIFLAFTFAFAQNEQSPMVEKEITYKDWTYKNPKTGTDVNLRSLANGKKLTIVVYYAPWCPNWRHDAPMLQRFYDKYKDNGLEIVGVGEYDPVDSIKNNLDFLKVTFPTVYESQDRADKQKTLHYEYRKSTGDTRGWGSPWYIMLTPAVMEKKGDVLTKKTWVVNGELIESEGDAFIRKSLGLAAVDAKASVAKGDKIEVCDPADTKTSALKKP
ncbi:MAG: TlpA disulfide reductase family protein [Pyrinomonadaceae bacterium]